MRFDEFFETATGFEPFHWQRRVADGDALPDTINIPTGLGKTAIILAWLWRRKFGKKRSEPRRCIYCLPMRTLVSQTAECTRKWIGNLESAGVLDTDEVNISLLMGGSEDIRKSEWDSYPEKCQILIGTQDQLLSRALNRGYAMSRYRWPVHFALLNNDCVWILDEIQLMGSGLTTSLQLDGFRKTMGRFGPVHTIWMSATIDPTALQTVDHPNDPSDINLVLSPADLEIGSEPHRRYHASKPVGFAGLTLCKDTKNEYANDLASLVVSDAMPGRGQITLVIMNTVKRCIDVYNRLSRNLEKSDESPEILLLHSRFRPFDRRSVEEKIKETPGENGRIVVSTQVVEAGVDLDSQYLVTELAPWSSLVQRFGRCNRRGLRTADQSGIFWVDIDSEMKNDIVPYKAAELNESRQRLYRLADGAPVHLDEIDPPEWKEIPFTIRRRELMELYDTSPDLAGWDMDVSRYIREDESNDVMVFWRCWAGYDTGNPPGNEMDRPAQNELCSVSIPGFLKFYKSAKDKLKRGHPAFVWDPLEAEYCKFDPVIIRPGLVILLNPNTGNYSSSTGWGSGKDPVEPVEMHPQDTPNFGMSQDLLAERHQWQDIQTHTQFVVEELCALLDVFADWDPLTEIRDHLVEAGWWHDAGKAHPAFQNMLKGSGEPPDDIKLWAKSAQHSIHPAYKVSDNDVRKYFRHELVSGLLAVAEGCSFLTSYLAAAHHGKVRLVIRSLPGETIGKEIRHALGVAQGDYVPSVILGPGRVVPEGIINMEIMEMGRSMNGKSWTAQSLDLLHEFGPFKLAFLEMLLRVSDWRGSSRKEKNHE